MDAFFITSDIYELTSCTCLLPTIVCRTRVDEPHNVATSRQTGETMVIFKTKMGLQNYVILNALRRKNEQRVANTQDSSAATGPSGAENVSAVADQAPEAEARPQPAMMQQIDGTASSMPSRNLNSRQLYDEDDNDNYIEGGQDRGGRRPPIRPLGKADKPPAWKGSNMECWQEYTVSLQAWYIAN